MPSDSERLTNVVIGCASTSVQDFNSLVGITSSVHDESVDEIFNLRISSVDAGVKVENTGGFTVGRHSAGSVAWLVGIDAHSLVILSLKKFKKEVAKMDEDSAFGKAEDSLRPSKEFRVCHNFLGLSLLRTIRVR